MAKMVTELWEGRRVGWREEVLAEGPLDDPTGRVVRMVGQVEEAALFELPAFFVGGSINA
jgi:hypothetical protein